MPVQKAQNPNTTPSQKIIPTVSLRVEVQNEFCVVVDILKLDGGEGAEGGC
jgi:hypothetical protein